MSKRQENSIRNLKNCNPWRTSLYLNRFKKRIKRPNNFRVLPLEPRNRNEGARFGNQDLHTVREAIIMKQTLNFAFRLFSSCSVCFFLTGFVREFFFLLVCFIYGATTKQPLCFQLPSVFNSKPIKVILFHINTAAHSDKKSHFNGNNCLRKANENQSFLLLPMKGKFSLEISSKGKLLC